MDVADSQPSVPPAPGPRRRVSIGLMGAFALTVLHFLWLTTHLAPAIMSPDANGYVVQARLIANDGRTSFATASPAQFVGMHWLETEPGTFYSRYPAGLPLIFAGAWKVGGLKAALFVNPILASATVFLVFLLARRFVGDTYAVLAAAVVAAVPVTNQHALDADAHIAATFFLIAGTLTLLRFAVSRTTLWGLLAGVLLGMVPTIRYPEALAGVAIGGWLLWQIRPVWRVWPAAAGAALPLAVLFVHNAAAYGAFWRTGYALTNEQTGFGLGYFTSHVLSYLEGLSGQGLSLMFAFGAAGLAALVVDARRRAEGVLFVGLAVPLVLLYMAYYFGGGGMGGAGGNLRFIIPTFPFFAVAGVWLLSRLAEHLGAAGRVAAVVVAALQMLMSIGASSQTLAQTKTSLTSAARARAVAEKEIPAGSIVIVDRQLAESFDAAGEWKLVDESLVSTGGQGGRGSGIGGPGFRDPGPGFPGLGAGGFGGGGGFRGPMGGLRGPEGDNGAPSPQQAGKNQRQRERYAGLSAAERRERIWADIVTWAAGKPIYWFARSLDAVESAMPAGSDYRSVAEVDAPTMFGPGRGGGGPMGGMMPGGIGVGARGGRGMVPGRGMAGGNLEPPEGMGPNAGPGRGGAVNAVNSKLRIVQIELGKS